MKYVFCVSLLAVGLLSMPAGAEQEAEKESAKGISFNEMTLYLASPFQSGAPVGVSLGGYVMFDWGTLKHPTAIGLVSEAGVGLGLPVGKGLGNTIMYFDIVADVIGVAGQLSLGDVALGAFYEPIEFNYQTASGYLGSKLELRVAWKEFQLRASRGGNGFLIGFLVPQTWIFNSPGMVHTVRLDYRLPNALDFGLGFRFATYGEKSPLTIGVSLNVGWWFS